MINIKNEFEKEEANGLRYLKFLLFILKNLKGI